jgi:protein-S-isoprenylcysteine O-methyltransferase Ste14
MPLYLCHIVIDAMKYIAFGILGFITFHAVDIAAIRRLPLVKPLTWFAGCALVIYAAIMACLNGTRFYTPLWLTVLGWLLLIASLAQILYSLFISLPFYKTYLAKGVGNKLITTGLYSIVRHPGVYGLGVTMLALVIISGSRLMAVAAVAWIVTDIIVVVIQDYVFFSRMFPDYSSYREVTPLLIPNRRSLSGFRNREILSNLTKGRKTP